LPSYTWQAHSYKNEKKKKRLQLHGKRIPKKTRKRKSACSYMASAFLKKREKEKALAATWQAHS